MSLELIQQKAKSLMENIYEYDRLKIENVPQKELKNVRDYAMKLIEKMRESLEKEKRRINAK
ncbi:MAG: hypothetical protein KKA65_05370 [Nanoarchaeota archaeon]|nr:hypothetical protein [Nanoarchaeota archaeon]MBU4242313.1 hypothetical protein [Nanoarchaeota archaeon]MBU4351635.1 hypothetical protein [Nanoarchaeota archaeon]MBU4456902.1 hypothetical protein [Nanoarchaeota archaeon]MCG2719903.1 hypothetical protein [Nanoarchaeota archaeon]